MAALHIGFRPRVLSLWVWMLAISFKDTGAFASIRDSQASFRCRIVSIAPIA